MREVMRRGLALNGLLFAVFLNAGCEGSVEESSMVVRDSAGVRIVEHQTLPERTAFVLGNPLYRAGWTDEGPAFGRIRSAALLESGGAAIGDIGADELVILNEIGQVVETLGGPGEGPGEIGLLMSVHALPDDTLVVEDDGNARITLYHGEQAVSIHTVEDGRAVFGLMAVGLQERQLTMTTSSYSPYFEEPWLRAAIVRHPLGTQKWDTISLYDYVPRIARDETAAPFLPIGHVGVRAGGALIARGDRPQVEAIDLQGRTTQIVRWEEAPLELTDSIWSIFSAYRMGRAGSRPEEEMRELLGELRALAGETLPYMSEVRGDQVGRIWVSEFTADYQHPSRYRVFGQEGDWLGWVVMPPRTQILDIGRDRILAVQRDQFDVEAVVVWPIATGI